jgi:hypothetical protein
VAVRVSSWQQQGYSDAARSYRTIQPQVGRLLVFADAGVWWSTTYSCECVQGAAAATAWVGSNTYCLTWVGHEVGILISRCVLGVCGNRR